MGSCVSDTEDLKLQSPIGVLGCKKCRSSCLSPCCGGGKAVEEEVKRVDEVKEPPPVEVIVA
jgi:flavoprotein